ncbi:type I toxin-antitoxin system Fst family toxin [Lactovum odontotermitis]
MLVFITSIVAPVVVGVLLELFKHWLVKHDKQRKKRR